MMGGSTNGPTQMKISQACQFLICFVHMNNLIVLTSCISQEL